MIWYRRFLSLLHEWPWMDTLRTLRQRFREDRLGVTAGSLTFTTTIGLVPLLTVMLALFTAFPVFARFRKALETQFLPGFVPDVVGKQVMLMLTRFSSKASQLGGVSLVVLGLTAMFLMLTIDHTLNAIWRVRSHRPIAQRVLVYWAALTLGPLLMGASLSLTSYLLSASRGWVEAVPGTISFLLNTIVLALQTAAFAALFRFVPNTHVKWEHAWAGALFVSLGLELAQRLLAYYLSRVPVYATIYGAFAAMPIFLTWIYVSWLIVLQGAVVAAYAPSLVSQVKRWPDTPGSRFQMALALLWTLADAQHTVRIGYSGAQLAELLRTDPLQIEPVLETLVELDWVGCLNEPPRDDGARFVLLCDPSRTLVSPLVQRLLLQSGSWTGNFWLRARFDDMTVADALGQTPMKDAS